MHKEGCNAEATIKFGLISRNQIGPDMQLLIDSKCIYFDRSMSQDGHDKTIWFNFCPLCGCKYEAVM